MMMTPVVLASVLVASAPAAPSSPRDALVVSVGQLAERLQEPDLVLLHVGEQAEYDRAHLPGARHVKTSDLSVSDPAGLRLEMLAPDVLKARLEGLGVSDRSRVVVYYGQDWISPATRILFTLLYAGLGDRAALLDGGQAAWQRAGHPVTAEVPAPREGTLSPLAVQPLIVDAAYVRGHLGTAGVAVVDARLATFYDGSQAGGSKDRPHKAGHIRGALSIPISEITDEQLVLKSERDLRALFDKAGVKAGDTVVTYCHIGQQATAVLFAARTLGHRVLLYDGSFEDWTSRADAPVEPGR
jgi:thiosulfate/3-mercaptopyruvate sulfurtransferase